MAVPGHDRRRRSKACGSHPTDDDPSPVRANAVKHDSASLGGAVRRVRINLPLPPGGCWGVLLAKAL